MNSDKGTQFTSDEYIGYVKGLETVQISMDGKGRATDNAYVERFFRTIKYDKLYLEMPKNGTESHRICKKFIHLYNEKEIIQRGATTRQQSGIWLRHDKIINNNRELLVSPQAPLF